MSRSSSKVVKIDTPYDDECNDEGSDKEDQFAFMSRKVRNMWKKRSGENTAPSTTIITTSTTTIHTDGDPNIDIEHFFEISMLEELIRMLWWNTQLKDWKTIVSKVLRKEVVLSMKSIA
ncbi:hypothetical protein JHK85_040852 [Glycine max]|nr:hypothetical protein JHK86_040266 [Glycine max]KAG4965877.1 hypothetical protein JHK85_040852 [Glycine max]